MAAVVFLIILAAVTFYVVFTSRQPPLSEASNRAWEQAIAQEDSAVGRILVRVSRPMASSRLIADAATSPAYRVISQRIVGAGGVFGGSIEVFLAVQAFCAFLAATIVGAAIVARPDTWVYVAVLVFAAALVAYPYNVVAKRANTRGEAVASGLPEFAELLQMPLSTGMGVLPALSFTAERLDGPVADETRRMLQVINSRSLPEADAFQLAAARLGTPEAQSFFNAVMQAHLEGSTLMDTLSRQAEALRFTAYQAARAKAKRLPVSLVLIMALHFIPTLLIIVLIPGAISLGSV
jgi:Flp pilus assembly protein TadB